MAHSAQVRELLQAERCTIFIVDKQRGQLTSTKTMSCGVTGTPLPIKEHVENVCRIAMGKGIAGHVACTGQ